MSSYISPELLIEIFKRLPVKSIGRCRCVCKSWYSLITSSSFISIHLTHSIESNSKTYPLVKKKSLDNETEQFVLYDDNSNDSFIEYKELDISFMENYLINHPSGRSKEQLHIVGSCNGLICVCGNGIRSRNLYLWNPAIGECVTVFSGDVASAFGFGFDCIKNDYKVVSLVSEHLASSLNLKQPLAQIYELSSNSWRTINGSNITNLFLGFFRDNGPYFNGVSHWLAAHVSRSQNNHLRKLTIATFDFVDEVFREVLLPDALSNSHEFQISLLASNQSLALIHYGQLILDDRTRPCCADCSIWVMKQYGVHQSWSKQFTINLGNHGGIKSGLRFRGNGEVLLQMVDNEIASYDAGTEKLTPVGVRGSKIKVFSYMESLLLLKGLNGILGKPDATNSDSYSGGTSTPEEKEMERTKHFKASKEE